MSDARATAAGQAAGGGHAGAAVRDTATTMAAEVMVLVAGLLLYGLAARYFGSDGVGEVAVVKRGSALLQPLAFLGLQTGLPYLVARAAGSGESTRSALLGGALVLLASAAAATVVLLVLPGPAAHLLMGDPSRAWLVPALGATLISILAYGGVRSLYFGLLRIPVANLIQILAVAVAPTAVILAVHRDPGQLLVASSAATTVVALASAVPLLRAGRGGRPVPLGRSLRALLAYSAPRMPGDLAMAGLMSIGVVVASHLADLRSLSYLSTSQSLVSAITAGFIPLSVVLLPRAAGMIAAGKLDAIRGRINALVALTAGLSILVAGLLAVFADVVLYVWLGPDFRGGAAILRAMLAGVPFLSLFFSLRGLIDAATPRPIHTYNLFVTLVVTVAGYAAVIALLPPDVRMLGLAWTTAGGFAVLAALTLAAARRVFSIRFAPDRLLLPLAVNAVAIGLAVLVHMAVAGRTLIEAGEIALFVGAVAAMGATTLLWPQRGAILAVIRR